MRRFLILLAVIIFSSVFPVSAYEYIHTLTNPSGSVGTEFPIGTQVTDIVTSSTGSFDGDRMQFKWRRPNNGVAQVSFVNLYNNDRYIDSFTPDLDGTWIIEAKEFIKGKSKDAKSSTFAVIQAPEFGILGLAAPLFMIGLFYIGLRKRML